MGRCDICGQRLTDATGSWVIVHHYTGVMNKHSRRYKACSSCEELVGIAVRELSDKRVKERKEGGWGE